MELSFIVLKDAMNHHLAKMIANATHLFVADVSKEEMWQTYQEGGKSSETRSHRKATRTGSSYDGTCGQESRRD